MKTVVILSYANFPNGEAASVRIHAICKIFMSLGYDVRIISMSREDPFVWKEYDGIKYISIRSKQSDLISRAKNVILHAERVKKVLKECGDIDVLLPLSLPIPSLLYCERYAKSRNISLVTDRTEWYSPCEFSMGRLSPQYLQNVITNQVIIDKYWKVISISRLFYDYFQRKNVKTVRIPAIMDVDSLDTNRMCSNDPRIVVYAGSPAKKDSLSMIVKAFCLYNSSKVVLKVYGVSRDSFVKKNPWFTEFEGRNVCFYGRVAREEVLNALIGADFSTVFRDPDLRFAKAGFPSKVAESLSSGTPPLTNMTSDLDLYLGEENSVIIQEYNVDSYINSLKRIEQMSDNEIDNLKRNARETAERCFDYSRYIGEIRSLLDDNES